jgi:hypothetical protein
MAPATASATHKRAEQAQGVGPHGDPASSPSSFALWARGEVCPYVGDRRAAHPHGLPGRLARDGAPHVSNLCHLQHPCTCRANGGVHTVGVDNMDRSLCRQGRYRTKRELPRSLSLSLCLCCASHGMLDTGNGTSSNPCIENPASCMGTSAVVSANPPSCVDLTLSSTFGGISAKPPAFNSGTASTQVSL